MRIESTSILTVIILVVLYLKKVDFSKYHRLINAH